MIDLYDEFRRLVSVLEQQSIDYALCGGIAMAVHGSPRATIDIDLLIDPNSLERLYSIGADLGYTIRGKDLQFAKGAIEIRRISKIEPASGDLLSLDLLLVTPDILSVWQSRITADWEGGKLSVVSREGLIKMKQLRSSGQDLDDIERLQRGSDNG
jgi:Nucleotidyl transferase AbiEii toxin, Type IV TA system